MILAYPVATPEVKGKYMGLHGSFGQNIRALKRIGFNAIELFTCNPESFDAIEIKSTLNQYAMEVASVGTSHLLNQDGLSLMGSCREQSDAAMKRIQSVIRFATRFTAPVSIGKFRGNMSEPQNPDELKKLAETLKVICGFAADQGIDILIEPQNCTNINNVNSVADACMFLNEVKQANLLLHLDTYHLAITEDNPSKSILCARDRLKFVHLSDSERKIPGEGQIDFLAIFKTLASFSYGGYLSFEINQGDSPFKTAEKAFLHTSKIMSSLA